jgi:hypothetical protein
MIEGLLIIGQVVSCMWVDIVGLEIVSVDEAVSLLVDVLVSVVLEALPVEVFPECRVGEVA